METSSHTAESSSEPSGAVTDLGEQIRSSMMVANQVGRLDDAQPH